MLRHWFLFLLWYAKTTTILSTQICTYKPKRLHKGDNDKNLSIVDLLCINIVWRFLTTHLCSLCFYSLIKLNKWLEGEKIWKKTILTLSDTQKMSRCYRSESLNLVWQLVYVWNTYIYQPYHHKTIWAVNIILTNQHHLHPAHTIDASLAATSLLAMGVIIQQWHNFVFYGNMFRT